MLALDHLGIPATTCPLGWESPVTAGILDFDLGTMEPLKRHLGTVGFMIATKVASSWIHGRSKGCPQVANQWCFHLPVGPAKHGDKMTMSHFLLYFAGFR